MPLLECCKGQIITYPALSPLVSEGTQDKILYNTPLTISTNLPVLNIIEELLELVKCLQALPALGNLEAEPDLLTKQHLGLPLDRDEEGSLSIHKATYPIGCQVHNAFSLSSHGPPIPPLGGGEGW